MHVYGLLTKKFDGYCLVNNISIIIKYENKITFLQLGIIHMKKILALCLLDLGLLTMPIQGAARKRSASQALEEACPAKKRQLSDAQQFMADKKLQKAIKELDIKSVTAALKDGANAKQGYIYNTFTEKYETIIPLDYLMEHGGDTITEDITDDAKAKAEKAIMKLLVTCGANVNTKINSIPLIVKDVENPESGEKSWRSLTSFIENLLEFGANINEQDSQGKTALMVASETNITVFNFLLEKGADTSLLDEDGASVAAYINSLTGAEHDDIRKEMLDAVKKAASKPGAEGKEEKESLSIVED